MIRVVLPHHLRTLARVGDEVQLEVKAPATRETVLDALEAGYPMLRGTIRDHVTQKRRPLVRFFACAEDISHDPADALLPEAITTGAEPFFIMGAIAIGVGKAPTSTVVRVGLGLPAPAKYSGYIRL